MRDASGSGPSISIIVPVYNSENYLAACLDSLIGQTLQNIEVLAVDDGSIDGSPAIMDSYAARDDRVRVIHKHNSGVSDTRNKGLELAQGSYVMFVDADDFIRFDACEKLLGVAQRECAEIVVFGGKTFPTIAWADDSFASRDCVYAGRRVIDGLMNERGSRPFMCNKLYARDLIERAGARLSTKLSLGEDQAFQMSIFPHAKRIAYTGEMLYFYRNHEGSTLSFGSDVHDMRISKHLDVVEYVLDDWEGKGLLSTRGTMLLDWLVSFLYGDVMMASFDLREEVCKSVEQIVSTRFRKHDVRAMDEAEKQHLNRMIACAHAMEEAPRATFVVLPASDAPCPSENLASILLQSEQRIRCLVDKRCIDDAVESLAALDKRCAFVDVGALYETLALIESPYVIFADANCRYSANTVERLFAHIELLEKRGGGPFAPDAVMFEDRLGRIRAEEPFFKGVPAYDVFADENGALAFDDLDGRGYPVCALSLAGKLIRADYLREHCPHGCAASYGLRVQTALALQFASKLVFFHVGLYSYGKLAGGESQAPWPLAQELGEFVDYRKELDATDRAAYDVALAHCCLAIDDAIADFPYHHSIAEALMEALGKVDFEAQDGDALKGGPIDEALLASLIDGDFAEHRIASLESNLERSLEMTEECLDKVDFERERVEGLLGALSEYEGSISYRVGRLVTWPVRAVLDCLQEALGR